MKEFKINKESLRIRPEECKEKDKNWRKKSLRLNICYKRPKKILKDLTSISNNLMIV